MLGVVLAGGWRRGGVPGPSAGAGSPMRGSKVAGAVGGGEPNCLRGDVFGVTPRVEVRGRVVGVRPPFARPGIEWRSCRSGHMVVVFVGPVATAPSLARRTGCQRRGRAAGSKTSLPPSGSKKARRGGS